MASRIISATVDITVTIDTAHLLPTSYIKMLAYLLALTVWYTVGVTGTKSKQEGER